MNDAAEARAYHHGNLRAELVDEAEAQLRTTPVEQLSLRALARALGVSQTAPYRHFSDKEALLAAIATRAYERLLDSLLSTRRAAGESAEHQLFAVARSYIDFAARNEHLYKLMFGPQVHPTADYPELRQVSRQTLALVSDILRTGIARGEFIEGDTVYLANAAWAGIHGVATLRIDAPALFREHIDMLKQIDTSVGVFIAGIRASDT